MEDTTQVVIREGHTGYDHAFLYSTWRNALWYAEKRPEEMADRFYKAASEKIAGLLKRHDVRFNIACLHDDSGMLLGWSVLRGAHLEFVYVKVDYRRKGIGRLLTRGFKTFSPPETKIGKSIAKAVTQEKSNGREEVKAEST